MPDVQSALEIWNQLVPAAPHVAAKVVVPDDDVARYFFGLDEDCCSYTHTCCFDATSTGSATSSATKERGALCFNMCLTVVTIQNARTEGNLFVAVHGLECYLAFE